MKRDSLLYLLKSYNTSNQEELSMKDETIKFIELNKDCFERSLAIGHITASGWVVSPDRSKVLLMHHRKLDRWFQPGGHCDGESDTAGVARKEVSEETGLMDFVQIASGIFDVDIHLIPENSKEKEHPHYDIRYVFEADPAQDLHFNHESKDLQWVKLDDVSKFNDSESIMRMVYKTKAGII